MKYRMTSIKNHETMAVLAIGAPADVLNRGYIKQTYSIYSIPIRQLLQISSVMNGQFVKTPWRTFEFDACFRTITPIVDTEPSRNNVARVKGAYKNVISS